MIRVRCIFLEYQDIFCKQGLFRLDQDSRLYTRRNEICLKRFLGTDESLEYGGVCRYAGRIPPDGRIILAEFLELL